MERARMPEKKWYGVHVSEIRARGFLFFCHDLFKDDKLIFKVRVNISYQFCVGNASRMTDCSLPLFARGCVVKGFGRGSKELGTPTANLPREEVMKLPPDFKTGVYFGWAKVDNGPVYKMVMSLGWNPFYKNKEKSMEIHILHVFEEDFYGCILSVIVLGYIRPELDFDSIDSLKNVIKCDIEIAKTELEKLQFSQYQKNLFFSEPIKMTCQSLHKTS